MAITINSAALSNGMPSAPLRAARLNVDLDNSYPTGGYDVSGSAALAGGTVVMSPYVLQYDGTVLRWARVEGQSLKMYVNTNGAPGVEVTNATDVSGHTGLEVDVIVE